MLAVVLHPAAHTQPVTIGIIFLSVFAWIGLVTLVTAAIGARHIRRRNSR